MGLKFNYSKLSKQEEITMNKSNVIKFGKNNSATIDSQKLIEAHLPDGRTYDGFIDSAIFVDTVRENAQADVINKSLEYYEANKPDSYMTDSYSLGGNTTGQVNVADGRMYASVNTSFVGEAMQGALTRMGSTFKIGDIDESVD